MQTGWRYRLGGVCGVAILSAVAVFVANLRPLQVFFTTYVPLFWRLDPIVLSGQELYVAMGLTAVATLGCLLPLYKPRPRRLLDIISLAHKRVLVAGSILATVGFFEYSHRLPRATLVMAVGILFVTIPAWFIMIRHSPNEESNRAIIVGDDPDRMKAVLEETELPIIGYVAPPTVAVDGTPTRAPIIADGGHLEHFTNLGGLSRLDEVLVEYDIDTALLAFGSPDRAEFFGALDACYEHGVTAKVHRQHADSVLTSGFGGETLLEVELEPWDTFDHIAKRAFDVLFAASVLLVVSPLLFIVALAIKLEDRGPILYTQERTATFGDTFNVYKFRSMVIDAESESGATISKEDNGGTDSRVTKIGRFIRPTHIDELPQLWSILVGRMSVVGPRPERPELEFDMETDAKEWRSRWFVKPGLTGLAQINGVTGHEPETKLRYDVEYIRRQSFWFDLQIVTRQIWQVLTDLVGAIRSR